MKVFLSSINHSGTVLLAESDFLKLAKDLKFTQRAPEKLMSSIYWPPSAPNAFKDRPVAMTWPHGLKRWAGSAPSRQAVSLRLNQAFENILQQLLDRVITRSSLATDWSQPSQSLPLATMA